MTTESFPRTLVLIVGALFCLTRIPESRTGGGNSTIERLHPTSLRVPVQKGWLFPPTIVPAERISTPGSLGYVVQLLPEEADRLPVGSGGTFRCAIDGTGPWNCVIHRRAGTDRQGYARLSLMISQDNQGRSFAGGWRVSVTLPLRSVIRRSVIPRDAVVFRDGLPWVLTSGTHDPEWRPVGLGDHDDALWEVLYGIDDGDSVAVGVTMPGGSVKSPG